MAAGLGSAWASLWPPLAVLYVLYAWVTALTRPALVAEVVLGGTAATGAAVLLVVAGLHLLRHAGRLSWPLPTAAQLALPTLKPRTDRIVAGLGAALAVALLLAAPVVALLGWDWVDAGRLLERPLPRRLAGQAASAALVVLGASVLWALVASWIDARLAHSEAMAGRVPGQDSGRARTLLALFRNAFTVAVAVIAGMVALSQLGLDIAPLLAGAGVVGLAVGFGAQTLVKDIITGVFIQLEGAIDVGDVVSVAGITGGVERLTIRSVRLRTMDGATHVIPFSSVTTVTNLTRDYGYHVADLVVGYGQSVPAVRAAMEEAFARLLHDPLAADVDGALDMHGVAELRGDAVLVRARIRTRAGRQWDVGRRYSELLKEVLDERGIEVPAPTRTILVPHAGPASHPAAAHPGVPGLPEAPA
jgi:small conductance mechanosensitive channel